jgi:hypothetical protein
VDKTLRYPWLRTELLAYLKELSDPLYQKVNWFSPRPDKIIGISPLIDFIFDSQNLEKEPERAVGLYLFEDEVPTVKAAAAAFSTVVDDLDNICDSSGAISHPGWPKVIEAAQVAVVILEKTKLS